MGSSRSATCRAVEPRDSAEPGGACSTSWVSSGLELARTANVESSLDLPTVSRFKPRSSAPCCSHIRAAPPRELLYTMTPAASRTRFPADDLPAATTSPLLLSPALLSRAKAAADEHARANAALAKAFDTATAKRMGELSPVAHAFKTYQKASASLVELKALLADPQADEELRSLASEDMSTATSEVSVAARTLTTALVPRHPFAQLPCLIEIRPGVGGSEAALFAGDLLRMYQALCPRLGLRATIFKFETSDGIADPNGSDAPLQEAILEVETAGSYGALRLEAGVHRVQRVPATESKGRTHTSAATVMVLPSFPANVNDSGEDTLDVSDPKSDYFVNPQDVRVDTMRARGAGGQHVNTTDSAVRLTHIPTGTVVGCQNERSQLQNRARAWQILRSRLAQARREAREEEMRNIRRSVTGVGKTGRGDKIRTYNWGQQRVTDHRSGITLNQLDDVLAGGHSLDTIMDSVRAWDQDAEVESLVAEAEATQRR